LSLFAHLISLHSNDATGFDTDLTSAHSLPTDKKIILTAHRPRGVWIVVFGLWCLGSGRILIKNIDQICDQIFIQIIPPLIKKLFFLSLLFRLSRFMYERVRALVIIGIVALACPSLRPIAKT
jgi:hypothetical protein